jgi:hypothetical protein
MSEGTWGQSNLETEGDRADGVRQVTPTPGSPRPWYREPWPWLLMAGPATVVVAGAITLWLAVASADGLVVDDYYRRGLAINRDLTLERHAAARGIAAQAMREPRRLRVVLHGAAPAALLAQLVHATRSGYDRSLVLAPVAPGEYEAELPPLPKGHWRLILEDPRREWRIVKEGL